jgi:hypothetical protein
MTSTLISVLATLKNKDFERMMGSGIVVSLRNLEDEEIVNDFLIPAEDMEEIKKGFISSLENYLKLRLRLRSAEIRDIKNALQLE